MRRLAILSLAFLPARLAVGVSADDCPASGDAVRNVTRVGLLAAWAVFLSATLGGDLATAQTKYRFINIADSSGHFEFFGREVSINNHGTVAFVAVEDNSNSRGIFAGNGESTSTIAHTSGPYSYFDMLGCADINDSGTVAFIASLDGGGTGVFVSDGVSTTTIDPLGGAGRPAINQSGQVAYWSFRAGAGRGVYIGNGVESILAANGRPTSGALSPSVSLGDDGFASFVDDRRRIVEAKDGVANIIVEAGIMVDFGPYRAPLSEIYAHSRSSSGATAFIGNVWTELGIYTVEGDVVTRVTDHIGPVLPSGRESVAINDAGAVAFLGGSGRRGIYTGGDPATDKVIGIGDSLFGSNLSHLQDVVDINNRGDIAFQYVVANGIWGIAVARVVPEPSAVPFFGAALAILVIRYSG